MLYTQVSPFRHECTDNVQAENGTQALTYRQVRYPLYYGT